MFRYLTIAVGVAAAVGTVAFAARSQAAVSAPSADPRVAALQKQVKALQKQVNQLQGHVVSDENQLSLNFEGDTCLGAQLADVIQGTWISIDQLSAATQAGKTYFGAQTPVTDYQNCADLAQPAVPRLGITTPPTINPLRPLLQWLHIPIG